MPGKSKREQLAHRLSARIRKAKVKRECLHPNAPDDCRGKIVQAHTVQRKLLKKISRNGRVYMLDFDMTATQSPLRMVPKGVSKASTFTGYCGYHDNQLFAPIEDRDLRVDQHHVSLLAYRSLTMELYNKHRLSDLYTQGLDLEDHSDIQERVESLFGMAMPGTQMAISDGQILASMGQAIVNGDFSDFYYYALELDCVPQILCSAGRTLACDVNGAPVQDLASPDALDLISVNVLPHRTKYGLAVFAWYGKSEPNEQFIRSFDKVAHDRKANVLVDFMFHNVESIIVSPKWWDEQEAAVKERLLSKSYFGGSWFTPVNYPVTSDETRYVNWNVVGKPQNNLNL
ncbi:MAG: hypothetical protein OXE52_10200 [Chloroflexi bacterium]|nr:hypothetical protein [Chloroflexota bacterium]